MANSNQGKNQGGDTSNRGFASMDKDKQREIAAEGGRASHASGKAHEFDSKEAAEAGSHSHDNTGSAGKGGSANAGNGGSGSGTRGGSSEQHAKAGRQSHKNS